MEKHTRKDERGIWRLPSTQPQFQAFMAGTEFKLFSIIIMNALVSLFLHLLGFYPIWIVSLHLTYDVLATVARLAYYDDAFRNLFFCHTTHMILASFFPLMYVLFLEWIAAQGFSFFAKIAIFFGFVYFSSLCFFALIERPLYSFKRTLKLTFSILVASSISSSVVKDWKTRIFCYVSLIPSLTTGILSMGFAAIIIPLRFFSKLLRIPLVYAYSKFNGLLRRFRRNSKGKVKDFIYHPIQNENGIRLVILKKRFPFQPINLTLYDANLDDKPDYEAISYCWGESNEVRTIYVNGHSLLIPKPTYDVLYSRSSLWRTRHFWIDYICINQVDFEEKSKQVRLMTNIFKSAWRVLVCLEGSLLPTYMAFSLLQELLLFVRESKLSGPQICSNCLFERHGLRWQCLDEFLGQAWFSRVWVIQEIAVAKSIDVLCGGLYFDFDMLVELGKLITLEPSLGTLFKSAPGGFQSHVNLGRLENMTGSGECLKSLPEAELIIRLHDTLGGAFVNVDDYEAASVIERLNFSNLLISCGNFQASDDRDRIFALFGLARDYPSKNKKLFNENDEKFHNLMLLNLINPIDDKVFTVDLTPNYSRNVQELYIDVARYFLLSDNPFFIFSRAGIGQKRNIRGLPSWVPDWSVKPESAPLETLLLGSHYRAGADLDASLNIYEHKKIFKCIMKSVSVTLIRVVGPVFPRFDIDNEDEFFARNGVFTFPVAFLAICTWHEQAFDFARQYAKPAINLSAEVISTSDKDSLLTEALWRTLIGNKHMAGFLPPPEFLQDYNDWVSLLNFGKKYFGHNSLYTDFLSISGLGKRQERPRLSTDEFTLKVRALDAWTSALQTATTGRRFCICEDGRMGLFPEFAQVGDNVHVFAGSKIPVLLRQAAEAAQSEQNKTFHVVGECYVGGIMDGEAFKQLDRSPEEVVLL